MPVLVMVPIQPAAKLHVPPVVTSVNMVVAPIHTLVVPVIAVGDALTGTIFVTVQPVPNE